MGLPRTGTTALHRLLHADPKAQGLELWLTQVPQPRPPRETWADDPIFAAMQAGFAAHHVESPEYMGIHYMDATSVEECWRLLRQTGKSTGLRVAGQPASLLAVAPKPGVDRRLRPAQGEPPARRPQRPGEALGAQEPVAHRLTRRADDRLPGRAGRLHAPRAGRLHRLVVLAVGRDDDRPVRHVHRRGHRPHPARPVVSRVPRVLGRPTRRTTSRSSSTSRSPICATTRSASLARSMTSGTSNGAPKRGPRSRRSTARPGAGTRHPGTGTTSRTTD